MKKKREIDSLFEILNIKIVNNYIFYFYFGNK